MDYRDQYKHWLECVAEEEKEELLAIGSDDKELRERFTLPLAFGTAGMRLVRTRKRLPSTGSIRRTVRRVLPDAAPSASGTGCSGIQR